MRCVCVCVCARKERWWYLEYVPSAKRQMSTWRLVMTILWQCCNESHGSWLLPDSRASMLLMKRRLGDGW